MNGPSGMPAGGAERPVVPQEPLVKQGSQAKFAEVNRILTAEELRKAQIKGEEVSISEEQLIRAIDRAIKAIQGPDTRLDFSIHDVTKRIMVKVVNQESGEIIREIPPEKNLDFLANLWKMAGILIDERL